MGSNYSERERTYVYYELIVYMRQALRNLFGIAFATVVVILIVPVLPIYVFRFIAILLAKFFRPDLGEILNPKSTIFATDLFSGKPPRNNIVICLTIEKNVTKEEITEDVWNNWLRSMDKRNGQLVYPKFQQYPSKWMGFTFYKHAFDTFNIDNHIHFHREFVPENPATEDDILALTEELLNTTYAPKTSPWEVHVVNNYVNSQVSSEPEMSVVILKIHHSLADGFSILKAVFEGICGYSFKDLKMPMPKMKQATFCDRLTFILTSPIFAFLEVAKVGSNFLRHSPWKIQDDKKAWRQYCAKSKLIPLQHIYLIKNTFGVTFTSVVVSAISAGMYRNLKQKRKQGKISQIEDDGSMQCFSSLPIPGHNKTLTNHSTGNLFDIPTTDFPGPLERLGYCNDVLEEARHSILPYLGQYTTKLMGSLPTSVIAMIGKNTCTSTGLANFPGLPISFYYRGKKCIANDFVIGGIQGNAGLATTVLRHDNYIRVCVSAEKAIMTKEEVTEFMACITNELDILYRLAKFESKIL